VDEETKASANFWKKHGKCVFCDLIEKESKGPRFVENNIHFAVFAPYASVNPMEFWILPTKHATNPFDMTQTEAMAFAITLRSTLRGLKNLVNDPPYNYGIHLSIDQEAYGYYHWHVEVYPKLAIWAGFEKSTGVYINTVPPEIAAAELQKAMRI
jgi:UDPglucose--hexose-1-phosphate uridylyltransferase